MYKTLLFLIILLPFYVFAQTPHWEGAIYADDIWAYHPGTFEPDSEWKNNTFNDSLWAKGSGGFGYSDNDDQTVITKVPSVYSRINFEVNDKSDILSGIIHADFDDGIIIYLNGNEVARSGISIAEPKFNDYASVSHEAQIYQGLKPASFLLSAQTIQEHLVNGTNTLAVEVHNISATSSDLTSICFLSLEIACEDSLYRPTPAWFIAPEVVTSTLPLIVIETETTINKDSKINGTMKIINHPDGKLNKITDKATDYDGYIGIKIRGNVSSGYPQKPYNIETRDSLGENNNVSLFGMPKENDWALVNNYKDKSCIKHALGYEISRKMGFWAAHTQHCEVVINGEPMGIYVFMESLKRDDDRIDIAKLKPEDTDSAQLTGGYIFKVDYYDKNNTTDNWISSYQPPHADNPVHFVYKYPDAEDIQPEQKTYLQDFVEDFENTLYSDDFRDTISGYRAYLNVPSFINYLIVQEVVLNNDGYKKSCHFHKDKNRKNIRALLNAGPVWDMDWGFRTQPTNSTDPSRGFLTGFEYQRTLQKIWPTPVTWWVRLMEDDQFANEMYTTYMHHRQDAISNSYLHHFIDSIAGIVEPAMKRHYQVWYNDGDNASTLYQNEINTLKSYIDWRMAWLDDNMPGDFIALSDFVPSPITYIDSSLITAPSHLPSLASTHVSIYPNPARDIIAISGHNLAVASIYSYDGKILLSQELFKTKSIDLTALTEGLYILQLRTTKGEIINKKLLIVK